MIQYIKTFSARFEKERPGKPINVPTAPPITKESVAEGKRLYSEVGCVACHGEGGRGDGPSLVGIQGRLGLADLAVGPDVAATQAGI